nr:MAG TPA: hypothetical protein [Caudoviricetes sp.]
MSNYKGNIRRSEAYFSPCLRMIAFANNSLISLCRGIGSDF